MMKTILKRCTMTDDGDFHGHSCEKCDHEVGGNGPDPYVLTDDESIVCVVCALGAPEKPVFILDPATTHEEDTVDKVLTAGLWEHSYLTGLRAAQADPEYQEAQRRWFNLGRARNGEPLEGEGVWDEDTEGPFWRWCDRHHRPFLMAAFKSLCDQLMAPETAEP